MVCVYYYLFIYVADDHCIAPSSKIAASAGQQQHTRRSMAATRQSVICRYMYKMAIEKRSQAQFEPWSNCGGCATRQLRRRRRHIQFNFTEMTVRKLLIRDKFMKRPLCCVLEPLSLSHRSLLSLPNA